MRLHLWCLVVGCAVPFLGVVLTFVIFSAVVVFSILLRFCALFGNTLSQGPLLDFLPFLSCGYDIVW